VERGLRIKKSTESKNLVFKIRPLPLQYTIHYIVPPKITI